MTDTRLSLLEAWGKLFRASVLLADDEELEEHVRERAAIELLQCMRDVDGEMRRLGATIRGGNTPALNRAFDLMQKSIIERTLNTDEERAIFAAWKNTTKGQAH